MEFGVTQSVTGMVFFEVLELAFIVVYDREKCSSMNVLMKFAMDDRERHYR